MRYEIPTQVLFIDDEGYSRVGIAYGDEIICACCGSIFEVDETPVYQEMSIWTDFSEFIK